MKINWKVRFKNPAFYLNLAIAIFTPIFMYMGLSWEDMTTWAALGGVLLEAVRNPVVFVAVIVSIANTLNDPTTPGLDDSVRSMGYKKPGGE